MKISQTLQFCAKCLENFAIFRLVNENYAKTFYRRKAYFSINLLERRERQNVVLHKKA